MYGRWQGPDRPVSNGAVVTRMRVEADHDAPATARAALEPLRGTVDEDVLERATLLMSEVVTNAVRYSVGPEVRLEIWQSGESLAVVVSDDGPGFDPIAASGTIADTDGGFGLPLLDTLSEGWGSGSGVDSWVWFDVAPRIAPSDSPQQTAGDELLDIRMVVESVKNHALVALDLDGFVTNWGAGPAELTGFSADEMLGRRISDLYIPASRTAFAREKEQADVHGWHRTERWIRRKDGTEFWSEMTLALIRDRAQRLRGLSLMISDITARKQETNAREHLIADLREQALTDELTGLPNRRHWTLALHREFARSRRTKAPLAVAMLDLDDFKAVNDERGHPAGDEVLQAVAREWSTALRTSDILARYGGDELAILLPDCPPDLALTVIGRVQAASPEGMASSAGIAYADYDGTAEEAVARADAALYEAKRSGKAVCTSAMPKGSHL